MPIGPRRAPMRDCNADLVAYHGWAIALSPARLAVLRAKRNTLRAIIKRRLASSGWNQPIGFRGQGSVSMGTIIREQYYSDYDIDDGVYFTRRALTGERGGDLSALGARQLILEAAYQERFDVPPEIRRNCVRIHYAGGFRIDVPVYRVSGLPFGPRVIELASADWRRSDPLAVTKWFKAAAARRPGFLGDRQLTRIVRYAKAWARSRSAWQRDMLGGFGITALIVEQYRPHPGRDDKALYDTLQAVRARLGVNTTIAHPVLAGDFICGPGQDAPVRHLARCLEFHLDRLSRLLGNRSRADALAIWDGFFWTDYFTGRRARFI